MYSFKSWLKIFVVFPFAILPHLTNAQGGLTAEYFNDTELKNRVLTRVESKPYLSYLKQRPAPGVNMEYFSTRWTGIITAPSSGDFTFSLRADDGVRFWMDDKILIDAWKEQEATTYEVSISMEKDKQYKMRIEYYNSWLHSVLIVSWKTPEEGFSIFGYSFFRSLKEVPSSAYSLDIPPPTEKKKETISVSEQKIIAKEITKSPSMASISVKSKSPANLDHRRVSPADSLQKTTHGPLIAVNELIKLKSVRFVLSKAELLSGSYEELDVIVAYLKQNAHLRIKIIGHTDYEGNWTANYTLSKQRANAVAHYLKTNGIAEQRITVEAMGASKPIVTHDNPQNREENRRVEFMLIDDAN